MARVRDIHQCIREVGFFQFCRRVLKEVIDDNLFTWAAALAYSWLFAVFPFLLFLLALLPHLPEYAKERATNEIHDLVYEEIPSKQSADMVWDNVAFIPENLLHEQKKSVLLLGLALALWSSASGMTMTMAALDRCYDVERGRNIFVQRGLALTLTVIVVALMLGILCLLPVGTAIKSWVMRSEFPRHLILVFDVARWSLSLVFMVSLLALVYYIGPSVRHRFRWLTPGALFCIIVWVFLALAFRIYIEKLGGKSYSKTYGALGGVVILLLFFYIDALVLLIGAEINSEVDFHVLKIRRGTLDFRPEEDAARTPAPTSI